MRVSFSHFELYFALHSRILSTFLQHLLQFPTIIYIYIHLYIYVYEVRTQDEERKKHQNYSIPVTFQGH